MGLRRRPGDRVLSRDRRDGASVGEIYDTAATWPERELNELFAIEFEGLDVSQRLFLPEDMLETQGKGQIMVMPLSELRQKNIEEGTK